MKDLINLSLHESNYNKLKNKFSWFDFKNFRTYSSPELAISESLIGISLMHPHKKEIYIKDGDSPYIDKIGEYISKRGLKKTLGADKINSLLASVFSVDNSLTGELFDFEKESVDQNNKKVFSIYVHHIDFLSESFSLEIKEYEIHIFCLSPKEAFSVLGTRAKKIIASSPRTEVPLDLKEAKVVEDKDKVFNFEKSIIDNVDKVILFFAKNDFRIYDRIIFSIEEKNGEFIVNQLGVKNSYTTSPCFWNHPFQLSWWKKIDDKKQWVVLPLDIDIDLIVQKLKNL